MFSNPVIRTAKPMAISEERVLASPSIRDKAGADTIMVRKRKTEMSKTSKSDAWVAAFASFLLLFAMHSDISFDAATGRPEATSAQHTE